MWVTSTCTVFASDWCLSSSLTWSFGTNVLSGSFGSFIHIHCLYSHSYLKSCCYPGHFAKGGPCRHWRFCCCCFTVRKEKMAAWESMLRKMWQKQLGHRQVKGIQPVPDDKIVSFWSWFLTTFEMHVRRRLGCAPYSHSSASPPRGNLVTRAGRKPQWTVSPLPPRSLSLF